MLLVDVVATAIISSVAYLAILASASDSISDVWILFKNILVLSADPGGLPSWGAGENLPVGLWFYSAFFTSAWLWLYLVSGVILRTRGRLLSLLSSSLGILDVANQPLRSMGVISMALVTILYLLVSIAMWAGA